MRLTRIKLFFYQIDLPYRLIALQVLGLGVSIFLSRPIEASTPYWIEQTFNISQLVFGVYAALCGLFLLIRRVTIRPFVALMFPSLLYCIGNATYVWANHLSSTVPIQLTLQYTLIMAIAFMGFRKL